MRDIVAIAMREDALNLFARYITQPSPFNGIVFLLCERKWDKLQPLDYYDEYSEAVATNDREFESLWKAACKNAERDSWVTSMASFIPVPEDSNMIILTNHSQQCGAGSLISESAMREVFKRLGTRQIIMLPSSIHEVIFIPKLDGIDMDEYTNMVREMNSQSFVGNSSLADKAYEFSFEDYLVGNIG